MTIVRKYLEEEEFRLKDMVGGIDKDYWQGCLYEVRKIIRRVRELE